MSHLADPVSWSIQSESEPIQGILSTSRTSFLHALKILLFSAMEGFLTVTVFDD